MKILIHMMVGSLQAIQVYNELKSAGHEIISNVPFEEADWIFCDEQSWTSFQDNDPLRSKTIIWCNMPQNMAAAQSKGDTYGGNLKFRGVMWQDASSIRKYSK